MKFTLNQYYCVPCAIQIILEKGFEVQVYLKIEQLHQALELIFMKLLDFVVVHFPEESIMGSLDWNKFMW